MPLYAYACAGCGPFEQWGPVADAARVPSCPRCGAQAARRFTPPGVRRGPAPLRAAREREERSAHAPEVVAARGAGAPLPWAHRH